MQTTKMYFRMTKMYFRISKNKLWIKTNNVQIAGKYCMKNIICYIYQLYTVILWE